jgi:hypothetical protein
MNLDEVADSDAEWPSNLISRATVVYETGRIARASEAASQAVDPDELAACRRLAREAYGVMEGREVGMGSEASTQFSEFFVCGDPNAPAPSRIDEALIRRAFGGTIFPPATITVEPLKEEGTWWKEMLLDGEAQEESYFAPWQALMAWFGRQKAFVDSAFVRVGDRTALDQLDESEYPEGTETTGCVLPRLALGLTRAGSLVGIFGYVVQT